MSNNIEVKYEATPNPASLKFTLNKKILDEPIEFKSMGEVAQSPLATKLFGFPWVDSVYIGTDFVTITKQDWVEWSQLSQPLANLIKEHFERGEPALFSADSSNESSSDSEIEKRIKEVINHEIRPAVAMDGGDIVFHKYENHVVYIYMRGACAGCPHSTMTLKMGIEARLIEAIPEIRQVVAL